VPPEPWWKSAVVYQIYPRSFADTDGDGVGDLEGIRGHLDHLEWLGVDAIWLSPFYPSPMADFGYDVSDYCDVDPLFGSLETFDRLLSDVHARGMRLVIDWVPNHSSSEHAWFVASRSSRDDPRRDWYIWRDPGPGGTPPNNWVQAFREAPAWTLDPATGQSYLHLFLPEQPDLNWANPEVEAAMHDTLRFWLDRGVDGFRMDVIHAIGKDPALPDDPPETGGLPHSSVNDTPDTHVLLRRIRGVLDGYDGDRMSVGEVFLLDTAKVATYLGDELHLAFNFPPLFTKWRSYRWARQLDDVATHIEPAGWPTWVLSNHDVPRHRTRYGSEDRARAAAVLLLGLRGTPFLYAGEELGLEDATIPADRVVDPGGRDGCRAPIPWDRTRGHGWGEAEPWLPWPPDPASRSVEALRDEPESILHLYRALLAARKASPALQLGDQVRVEVPDGALAWERAQGEDRRVVAVNFTGAPVEVPGLRGTVQVSSDRVGEGESFSGTLGPDQAVWLRP
jgi:alpha-glucosidase